MVSKNKLNKKLNLIIATCCQNFFLTECGSWDINSNGPAMARIFVGGANSPICAGVVVSKYAILTVASALIDADSNYVDVSSINVFLGVSDKMNPRYVYAVDRIEVSLTSKNVF